MERALNVRFWGVRDGTSTYYLKSPVDCTIPSDGAGLGKFGRDCSWIMGAGLVSTTSSMSSSSRIPSSTSSASSSSLCLLSSAYTHVVTTFFCQQSVCRFVPPLRPHRQ